MGSILNEIKQAAKNSGQARNKMFYVSDGNESRVRFLDDIEDAIKIPWYSEYNDNIDFPSPEFFGKPDVYAARGYEPKTMYLLQVYVYDLNEVRIFLYKANQCSPLPHLAAYAETYGNITDRDYVIKCNGKGSDRTMPVVPLDKAKFRQNPKRLSMKSIKETIYESKKDRQGEIEEIDYSTMSAKELYNMCEDRNIECEPKMKKPYYVRLLEEWDEEQQLDDGYMNEPEESDDDWGEDEQTIIDFNKMSAKELYDHCIKKGIDVPKRKSKEFYIDALQPKEDDEWDENGEVDIWDDEDGELPFN